MNNNDILRSLRYHLNCNNAQLQALFLLGGAEVAPLQIKAYLCKEEQPGFSPCPDAEMAAFLNGLIIEKRGKKDGVTPRAESRLNNNLILTKLKIAFQFKSDDILDRLDAAGFSLSSHELSGFFRKPGHRNFRPCQDQVLRYFLKGLNAYQNRSPTVWEQNPAEETHASEA